MSRFTSTPARSISRHATLGALVLTALGACQDDAPSPLAPTPRAPMAAKTGAGKPGTIETVLFSGTKNGNTDVYAMNPDGSNVRRLTSDSTSEFAPDFAPDNRKFVFVRYFGGPKQLAELYTANADGSKTTPLTTMGTSLGTPRWSPDGSKIVFSAVVDDPAAPNAKNVEIFVISADGTGLKRLTYGVAFDHEPAWSPDGQRIVFASDRLGDGMPVQLYVMNADGLNVQPVGACDGGGCYQPAWSPDGTRIAFLSGARQRIEVIDIATKTVAPIGPNLAALGDGGFTRYPTWSKDGTTVLFSSTRGIERTFELYAGTPGSADPASVRRLTVFAPGAADGPAFSH